MRISSLSKEYVRVPVSAREDGAIVDPTSDVVAMAFTPPLGCGTKPATSVLVATLIAAIR